MLTFSPLAVSGLPLICDPVEVRRARSRSRLERPETSSYDSVMTGPVHRGFDHVTIAVLDLVAAREFFGLLGFEETASTVVSGEEMSQYMGIPGWEADHLTLALTGSATHQEVQLLRFHHPSVPENPGESNLARLGFNHVCFAVDDLDAALARLRAGGVRTRSDIMEFHDRRLVFLIGPGDITVELAEWTNPEGDRAG
jgi:catechol 2,3-dioxygenase-like lactoylglutathione lyase family enzyme